jgi:hypothetical protein
MLIMIRNLTYSDLDSCHPEVMVPDARVFRSIKNEQKYPWLYQCGTRTVTSLKIEDLRFNKTTGKLS